MLNFPRSVLISELIFEIFGDCPDFMSKYLLVHGVHGAALELLVPGDEPVLQFLQGLPLSQLVHAALFFELEDVVLDLHVVVLDVVDLGL